MIDEKKEIAADWQRFVTAYAQNNGPARGLYENRGYRVTEKDPCTNADGQSRTGFTYEKNI